MKNHFSIISLARRASWQRFVNRSSPVDAARGWCNIGSGQLKKRYGGTASGSTGGDRSPDLAIRPRAYSWSAWRPPLTEAIGLVGYSPGIEAATFCIGPSIGLGSPT